MGGQNCFNCTFYMSQERFTLFFDMSRELFTRFFGVAQKKNPCASPGKFSRAKSRYPESFRFLCLWWRASKDVSFSDNPNREDVRVSPHKSRQPTEAPGVVADFHVAGGLPVDKSGQSIKTTEVFSSPC